ncbi:pyruvate dehydrogenase [Mariniluteicoccus endophyticus]
MVALWFAELEREDRISVKPHASPVLHAINHLLGGLDAAYLDRFRQLGGLQSYPSRRKDPDQVDFSTGSVGIGATAPIWAALSHRYLTSRFESTPAGGRFISLVGDAELDEGAIWEALGDPHTSSLGEVIWVIDLNRQSLDRVVPDVQVQRLTRMFEASGWQVIILDWGRRIKEVFDRPDGGAALRERLTLMPNEEYQRLLRTPSPAELVRRLLGAEPSAGLTRIVGSIPDDEWPALVRDLGGHDFDELLDAFSRVDDDRPTAVFAYTIKGRGLPTEGHPNNHSALLSPEQVDELAARLGMSIENPWVRFSEGTPEADLCAATAERLEREPVDEASALHVPATMVHRYADRISTQAVLGRFLRDIARDAPDVAARIVTTSPDVASSTNLGGWINLNGVWSAVPRHDWFDDDRQRLLRWVEGTNGQHIELGIAEVNLVSFLGELGTTWSRWGERLIPIGTLYDPFVERALEPWRYGMYAGGQSILVATPSGVTLAPEGGAHQSIVTPSIGIGLPECVAWEPAFAKDLEWTMLAAMDRVGVPDGTSAYFRLSTRPVDQTLAGLPTDDLLLERRRRHVLEGGYRLRGGADDEVTLVGQGAVMPQVVEAAERLAGMGVRAGVLCLTSADLVHRDWRGEPSPLTGATTGVAQRLFPGRGGAPLVTVLDGHPHALSFLGAIQGVPVHSLGVTEFGQSSRLEDAYALHGLDEVAIVNAALDLTHR